MEGAKEEDNEEVFWNRISSGKILTFYTSGIFTCFVMTMQLILVMMLQQILINNLTLYLQRTITSVTFASCHVTPDLKFWAYTESPTLNNCWLLPIDHMQFLVFLSLFHSIV